MIGRLSNGNGGNMERITITELADKRCVNYVAELSWLLHRHNHIAPPGVERVARHVHEYHVALLNQEPAGFVRLAYRQWYQTELMHLLVLPEHRRKGVARALIRFAKQVCDTRLLQCTMRSNNEPARRALLAEGFKVVNDMRGNALDGDNAYRLEVLQCEVST